MPKISIIIPNWNGLKYLKKCLKSVFVQTYKNYEVIVVDNNSTDNSKEWIKENFHKVQIIANSTNYGFAESINIGIKKAIGDYVVILNNDTKVDELWLQKLVEVADSNNKIGMVACLIFYPDHQINSAGLILGKNGCVYNRGIILEKDKFEIKEEIFGPCGCAALYKKEMLKEIGLFDPKYFAYYEDVDLAFRARLCGWKCIYTPEAIIYHHCSKTTKKLGSFKINILAERNKIWTIIKNWPVEFILKYSLFILLHEIIRIILYPGALIGIFKAFLGIKPIILERQNIQKKRKIKFRELNQFFFNPELRNLIKLKINR